MEMNELILLRSAENELGEKDETIKFLREKVVASEEKIKKAIGALKYAYEDHSDQFYLNVIEDLEELGKVK